ncbi:response regulator [Sphingomonas qilianensis]|uniref:Response regulator n=1 Tax=Sphingomonas qilianensis TaxID=1736690 RepID=A0ABU9XVC0_9SPHN
MEFHLARGVPIVALRQPKCILLVEDELLIRILVSDSLRDEGYEVVEAFNGDEAVEILTAGKAVDLVFSDVRMPGGTDGLGLLKFVKARFPDLPVILTSGHLDPRHASMAGAVAFLGKPYRIDEALEAVACEVAKLQ